MISKTHKVGVYGWGYIDIVRVLRFTQDLLIVNPDWIVYPWVRKKGHIISLEDLKKQGLTYVYNEETVIAVEKLILGIGYNGEVQVDPEVFDHFDVQIYKTPEAIEIFKKEFEAGNKIAGGFHLTC